MVFSSLFATVTLAHVIASSAPAVPVTGSARMSADTLPFDTTQVVVTPADFAQLLTFLQATTAEWSKPAMGELMKRHVIQYPMALGNVGTGVNVPPQLQAGAMIPIPNYAIIADSTPAVAQGLASAKLTGRRYLQLSRTLNAAFVTEQLDRLSHGGTPQVNDTSTVIGKNVAFIRSHQAEFGKLVQLALDVIPLQAQGGGMGGGGGDLDP